ncbi:DEAD/DEAH box helicase [Shewanella khirikhana]|uniref:DEAD/DEAH box helicase n=1 Tax=Shewanella khirikhana TaxID=1965282 RepID=UPI0030D58877
MTFSSLGLSPALTETVSRLGYQTPTDIQTQAIAAMLKGADVLAIAETGSGKTAAFALPILEQLLRHPLAPVESQSAQRLQLDALHASRAAARLRALVLVPTRELAEQVAVSVNRYAGDSELVALAVYGGVNIRAQTRALAEGVDVLVATPGRLWDLICHFGLSLDAVRYLVLDEADRMLDMGFAPAIDKIRTRLGAHQSALFSASFGERERALAKRWLREPVTVETAGTGTTPEQLSVELFHLDRRRWAEWLAELVGKRNYGQTLVFVGTKDSANNLVRELKLDGLRAEAFHGDKTQGARRRGLDEFKRSAVRLLVATDVAARGLDIARLPVVISLGMPHSEEDLLHRLGRSARAGHAGHAIVVLERDDKAGLAQLAAVCPGLPEAVTPAGYGPKDPLPERYRNQLGGNQQSGNQHSRNSKSANTSARPSSRKAPQGPGKSRQRSSDRPGKDQRPARSSEKSRSNIGRSGWQK